MVKKYVIGIDGGTQSSKVSIFDLHGKLICSAVKALEPVCLSSDGVAIHPDDDMWGSIAFACRQAMDLFPYDQNDILGVGLCTVRCCRALLDKQGALTMPVISWMDPSLSRAYQHTDSQVAYVTTSSGYLTHRLCGEFVDTAANYEGVWPIDKKTWQWSHDSDAFTRCQTPRQMLFDLVNPGEQLGLVTNHASQLTALPEGLPVFATANDKAVEALGAGLGSSHLQQEPTLLVSLGTYIGAMAYGDYTAEEGASYFHNMSCIPNRYLHESGGVRQGMGIVSWFRELLGTSVYDEAVDKSVLAEQLLNQEAQSVPIGCDGLLTLPDWLAPDNAPFKRGAIIGLKSSHTRAHIYRSILESIAMTMKNHVDAMRAEIEMDHKKIIVSGGGANSELFMQILADVFDLPTVNNRITGAAGLGSAICAAVGGGVYPSFDEALENMVAFDSSFSPTPRSVQQYSRLNNVFETVSKHTDVINKNLRNAGFQS